MPDVLPDLPVEAEGAPTEAPTNKRTWKAFAIRWLKLLMPVAILTIVTSLIIGVLKDDVIDLLDSMREKKPESCVYFVLFFAIWVIGCMSKTILAIASGYIYGFGVGFICSIAGMFLALIGTLVIVRVGCVSLGSQNPRERFRIWLLAEFPSMVVLNKMIAEEPFKACLLVRATYIPTFAKNYGLASLDAPLPQLFGATILTSSFYCVVFCYLGSAMQDLASVKSAGKNPLDFVMTGCGILLTISALLVVRHKVKQEMKTVEALQRADEVSEAAAAAAAENKDEGEDQVALAIQVQQKEAVA